VSGIFEKTAAAPVININTNASVEALLKRAALLLEDGEWHKANAYTEILRYDWFYTPNAQ